MNKGTTKSIEIQQDSMMRELTFEEISAVSGGGNFFTDLFRNPRKLIREGLGQMNDAVDEVLGDSAPPPGSQNDDLDANYPIYKVTFP